MIKIYVHHKYDYQLFWYLFHALKINPKDVPTTFHDNTINRKNFTETKVSIISKYKNNDIHILFVDDSDWDKVDGFHIYDLTTLSLQHDITSEVGLIGNFLRLLHDVFIPNLNKLDDSVISKTYIGWISWEGFDLTDDNIEIETSLKKGFNFYTDTFKELSGFSEVSKDSSIYAFTQTLYSFIFPDKTYMREYYLFHDWLKEKKKFKYKLLYPIRRIYDSKVEIAKSISKLKNKDFKISLSSYSQSNHFKNKEEWETYYDDILKLGNIELIDKRGYGMDDFGGEWMVNNMQEQLFKLFHLSEVNIVHENPMVRCFSEKTICHIFAGKPFIDVHYSTIKNIETVIQKHGGKIKSYPIESYDSIIDILEYLNDIMLDDKKWNQLKKELTIWVNDVRRFFIEYMNNNNSLLDKMITKRIII